MNQYEIDFFREFEQLTKKFCESKFIQFRDDLIIRVDAINAIETFKSMSGYSRIYIQVNNTRYESEALDEDEFKDLYEKLMKAVRGSK